MVNARSIKGLILVLILTMVLFKIAADVVPTAAEGYANLSDELAAQTDVLGTDAAAFGGDTKGYVGWFWVIGPFLLAVSVILGAFAYRRRR